MVDNQSINKSAIETITIDSDEASSPSDQPVVDKQSDISNEQQSDANKSNTSSISSLDYCPDTSQNSADNTLSQCSANASSLKTGFQFGPYVPILRKNNDVFIDPKGIIKSYYDAKPSPLNKRLVCEVLPDDAIVDAPSVITPLLLKKKTVLPPRPVDNIAHQQLLDGDQDSENVANESSTTVQDEGTVKQNDQHIIGDNKKPVEDYIRASCVASLTSSRRNGLEQSVSILQDYYKSSVGELLLGLGVSRVREYNLHETHRKLSRRVNRTGDARNITLLEGVRKDLQKTRSINKVFEASKLFYCPRCPFKTEFAVVMNGHLESPHVRKRDYLCNWCDYKTKEAALIKYHFVVKHKKQCHIEKPAPLHLCRYCPFEVKEKRRMVSHLLRCEQMFKINSAFLGPKEYGGNEFPGVTSKFITREDIREYDATLKTLRLAAYNPHQLKISGHPQNSNIPIIVVSRQSNQVPSDIVGENMLQIPNSVLTASSTPQTSKEKVITNGIITSNNHSAQLMSLLTKQNPNINTRGGTLQYPRTQSPFMNGNSALRNASDFVMGPQNVPCPEATTNQAVNNSDLMVVGDGHTSDPAVLVPKSQMSSPTKGSTFVICEICDGYIKDLGQLKSHMQWIHKVKIHQKMLISRPPLNCQKCQWRFFTDQGLERHLLGAHGLVTSNMQELVDNGNDSGRCTICGKAYANKLVAHMKEVHKLGLKPAHLTYKCTVCSATFNLYRLFENHVYSVHSESMKRKSAS